MATYSVVLHTADNSSGKDSLGILVSLQSSEYLVRNCSDLPSTRTIVSLSRMPTRGHNESLELTTPNGRIT